MKKIIIVLMSLFMVAALFSGGAKKDNTPSSAAGSSNKKETKVGFIYVGPPGDGGFTYQHDVARKYLSYSWGNNH